MDKFTKVIPIKFDVKDASLKEAERKIDNFTKQFQDGMSFDGLKEELETAFESKAMIAQVDELIAELEGLHGAEIDAFRSSLEAYREQLNPVKSMNQLLEAQYELHQQIAELEKDGGSSENLETLRQMSSELESQIALMGTDGQLAILEERRRIEQEILELSALDTKEARDKVKELEQQAKWLGKTYDISKDEHDDKKQTGMDIVKGGVEGLGKNFDVVGSDFSDMTSSLGGILSGFQKGFVGGLVATGAAFIASLGKTLKDGAEAAKELLASNRMSDSGTRETMFDWGTSRAGAYGVNQAMDIMGYSSQEDFMMADPNEQKQFLELQKKFANKYIEMQESGLFEEMLQSQIEMAEFEKELEMQEAEFYMENQESIMAIKEFTMQIQMILVQLFGWITKLGNPKYTKVDTKKASDILQSYSTTTTNNKTTSVSIDNSFNNQGISDQSSVENALHQMLNVVDAAIS